MRRSNTVRTNARILRQRIRNIDRKLERRQRQRAEWASDPSYGSPCTTPAECIAIIDREVSVLERERDRIVRRLHRAGSRR